MKHIIGIFTALLLPALPAFGAAASKQDTEFFFTVKGQFTGYSGDAPSGLSAKITSPSDCVFSAHNQKVMNQLPGGIIDSTIVCPPNTTSITLEFASNNTAVGLPKYKVKNPTQTIELTKKKRKYNLEDIVLEQINKSTSSKKPATQSNTTSSNTKTATAANSDFDFVAEQKKDRAAWETGNDAPTYQGSSKNTTTKKQTKKNTSDASDELQRVGEIHAADAEADAERSQPKQTKQTKKQEPDFDFAAASANDMNATVARSGLGNTLAPEPTTPEKSERQQQIEANTKKALTVPTKPAQEIIFEISGKIEIDNGALPSNITANLSPSTCKPAASKYFSGKNISKGYRCPAGTTSVTFTFLTEDQKAKTKYDIENETQTINLTGQKKYTLEKTIKFVTKKTQAATKKQKSCTDSGGTWSKDTCKCEKRNTVLLNDKCVCTSSDFEMHADKACYYTAEAIERNEEEMLAADEEATSKKLNAETKQNLCELTDGTWKNGKCKCPNGYEPSDTGECEMTKKTQTAAEKQKSCTDSGGTWSKNTCKCEKRNTILLNDECVCISGDFEMHADKACYYTAEAIDRNEEEMIRDDENKAHMETLKLLCEGGETKGTWTDDFKCECPDGYAVSSTNECEITDKAQKNANNEKACTETDGKWNKKTNECKCKTGFTTSREGKCVSTYDEEKANSCAETGGKWTKKNTCNCKNGWKLDADGFCQPNDKTAANNHKKELCTEPNKWNDTLKKCTCKDKKQFFDEETGCVSATADFLAAETELNTLKQQFETKKAELASAE